MEALQMLKFSLKQKRLNFIEEWAITEDELEQEMENDNTVDWLGILTSETGGNGIDKLLHVLGQHDNDG
jgi:hypothetical protein